jgi:arylsulfatase
LHKLAQIYRTLAGKRAARPVGSFYDDAVEWMESAEQPFFLWLFLMEPHTPYLPSPDYRSGSALSMLFENARLMLKDTSYVSPNAARLSNWYEDAIREVDDTLGRLREDVPDETAIAVHADHGEEFGDLDHGSFGHETGHYEENIHVPLVVDAPEQTGTVSDPISLTHLRDILVSIATDRFEQPNGTSTVSRVFNPNKVIVRTNEYKLVATINDDHQLEAINVYDIGADPQESSHESLDQAETDAGALKRLADRLFAEKEIMNIRSAVEDAIDDKSI